MRKLGFSMVDCGEDGPQAWAIAHRCNERWDEARKAARAARKGEAVESSGPAARVYPAGSLGEGYARYRATATWKSKPPRTREDWERGWKHIDPIFGDVDPGSTSLEDLDAWYAALLERVGVREAHRAMKIWRALWRVVAALKKADGTPYCLRQEDPSLGIRRKTPTPRNAIWREGEAVRLVKAAWRNGYRGLAAALAVAWDTMLSPVDVRTLTTAQLRDDGGGSLFSLARAKTGKAAIGTVSRRTERLVAAYIESLPFSLLPDTPIFHTRGGEPGSKGGRPRPPVPYTKDTLGDDFRVVRTLVFPGDTRKLMDFRRSGAVEAVAGGVDPAALAGKMANTIDQNRALQETYLPQNAAVVRLADRARASGRARLRQSKNGDGR
ncbi:hypothetical protein [Rhodoplanes roseus]|nr:hypothetical protein [Rhodoplanes roseus]